MILLCILLTVLFCKYKSKEEEAITRPVRVFSFFPTQREDQEYKKTILERFHEYGAAADGLFLVSQALIGAAFSGHNLLYTIISGFLTFGSVWLTYWIAFDIFFALDMGQRWYYLGDTAKSDIKLIRKYGDHIGRIKPFIAGSVVIILVVVYFLL